MARHRLLTAGVLLPAATIDAEQAQEAIERLVGDELGSEGLEREPRSRGPEATGRPLRGAEIQRGRTGGRE